MNIALLLKSELRRSAGILAGMALIIALALSIAVAAGICERMVKASAAQSADDFDLLIGARGSSSALLLGTVFLRDEMLPIVPASALAQLGKGCGCCRHPLGRISERLKRLKAASAGLLQLLSATAHPPAARLSAQHAPF